jgi:uncharacterized C2H2 Zn-finger protein
MVVRMSKRTRDTAALKYCHRCGNHYRTQKLLDKHLETCDPWAEDAPDQTRKTYLPTAGQRSTTGDPVQAHVPAIHSPAVRGC